MINSFIYSLKVSLHQKQVVFWNLLFPVVLATMFQFAFGGFSEEEKLKPIDVAVVYSAGEDDSSFIKENFKKVMEQVSEEGQNKFLNPVYVSDEEARKMLSDKKIIGILYEGNPVKLTVSGAMSDNLLEQSILNTFVTRYNLTCNAVGNAIKENPLMMLQVLGSLDEETHYNEEISYADGNMDERLTYFFNLIAMVCLYACLGGLDIATKNQANLSAVAARKAVSPQRKSISFGGQILATVVFQYSCILIGVFYMMLGLGVDFGDHIGSVLLTCFAGCLVGISMGFAIGSIGSMNEKTKIGLMIGISMICCFLSGLMAGGMRLMIEKVAPWFNHVNPAALISDGFYSQVVYPSAHRYFVNILTLFIISAVLCVFGLFMMRRKKYAAL